MSEQAICNRLEISAEQRNTTYRHVQFFNHEWNNQSSLTQSEPFRRPKSKPLPMASSQPMCWSILIDVYLITIR